MKGTPLFASLLFRYVGPGILSICFLVACYTPSHAQEFWKHFGRPDIGLSLYLYEFSDSTEKANLLHWGPSIGLNIPIVPLAEHLSLGINPSLGFSLQLVGDVYDPYSRTSSSSTLAIEVPTYATLKFNTDATWKGSKTPIGFTAGIGAHYNAFFFLTAGVNAGYIQPSYLVELNFGSRRGNAGLFKLRWTSFIGEHEEVFEEFNEDVRLSFFQSAVHVLWVPGY